MRCVNAPCQILATVVPPSILGFSNIYNLCPIVFEIVAVARKPLIRQCEVVPQIHIAGICLCKAFCDGEALPVVRERADKVALTSEHVAHPDIDHRQVVLPSRVVGIGLCETNSDVKAILVGGERAGQIALGQEHVTHLIVVY